MVQIIPKLDGIRKTPDGRYLLKRNTLFYFLITSAIGVALLFVIGWTYYNNGGSYLEHADLIFFYGKGYSADELHYIANHEIGHHVWFIELNDTQRKEYINIFNDSNYYITEYSKTKVEENFAEEYAFYMACNRGKYCLSPDRVDFFDDYILGYKIVLIDRVIE